LALTVHQNRPNKSSMLMAKDIANDLALVWALWRSANDVPKARAGSGATRRNGLAAPSSIEVATRGDVENVMQTTNAREATVWQQYRPVLMLWTAPPPARERHGFGCC